jgi:hypothetical protein
MRAVNQHFIDDKIDTRIRGVLAPLQFIVLNTPSYNFTCFVRVWNLLSNNKERPQLEDIWEQNSQENI